MNESGIPPGWVKINGEWFHPSRLEGVRTSKPERDPGLPLEQAAQGESPSGKSFTVCFTVYSRRPCDWDNYRLKELQDCLVHAGLLPGDAWDQLQGQVITRKARTKAEERTEVFIKEITPNP